MTEGPHLPEVRKGWLAATGEVLNRALGMGVFEALGAMACFGAFAVTKNPHFLKIGIGLSALAAGWATHYAMKRTALKGWLAAAAENVKRFTDRAYETGVFYGAMGALHLTAGGLTGNKNIMLFGIGWTGLAAYRAGVNLLEHRKRVRAPRNDLSGGPGG